jgi:hypothetical protein
MGTTRLIKNTNQIAMTNPAADFIWRISCNRNTNSDRCACSECCRIAASPKRSSLQNIQPSGAQFYSATRDLSRSKIHGAAERHCLTNDRNCRAGVGRTRRGSLIT